MPMTVCVKCKVRLRNVHQAIDVIETFGEDSDVPYKVWKADLYECPKCHFQVATGFGQLNYAEHYQEGFPALIERIKDTAIWNKSCY